MTVEINRVYGDVSRKVTFLERCFPEWLGHAMGEWCVVASSSPTPPWLHHRGKHLTQKVTFRETSLNPSTVIEHTTGNDHEYVEQSRFNRIQLQNAHTLRVVDQLLPEVVQLTGRHYPPRQEMSEIVLFRVIPVQRGDQDATLWLAEADQRALVSCRQLVESLSTIKISDG